MCAGRIKTAQRGTGEIVAFSESAVRNNAAVVEYCRTSMSALSGSTAGILGLTGFLGFGFYLFAVFGLWCLLLLKAGVRWEKYFTNRRTLLTNGFLGGLFVSFITFLIFEVSYSLKGTIPYSNL
ncbi:ER membrane protein complex subunit 6 [Frankliniella fusca]|uniref:ER membrane protein complex subunit 6 n=1 Tax=Frankliniella fusca TaxID=407009 RepID=A0AAE1HSQ5_9NEOP|nr:ER membrane protein complex subunit 6 [Frankliniella fusca]